MTERYDIDSLRGITYATIRAAFNTSDEIMEEHGSMGSVNSTGIITKIMHAVGRFNERWASDALFSIDKIRALSERQFQFCPGENFRPFDEIITFGIRRDGVDHGAYVMQNLIKDVNPYQPYVFPEKYYRKVLAVRCRACYDQDLHDIQVHFSFRDVTNAFHGIQDADRSTEPGSGGLLNLPAPGVDSPEPEERYLLDLDDVKKAKEQGPREFRSIEILPDRLMKEGTDPGARCFEIRGYYGGIVPADQDKGVPVCRVYSMIGFAVCWLGPYYDLYKGAQDEVRRIKAEITGNLEERDE